MYRGVALAVRSTPGLIESVAAIPQPPVSPIRNAVLTLTEMARITVSGPAARPAVESLLYAAAFTIVFAPLAVRAFKRRV